MTPDGRNKILKVMLALTVTLIVLTCINAIQRYTKQPEAISPFQSVAKQFGRFEAIDALAEETSEKLVSATNSLFEVDVKTSIPESFASEAFEESWFESAYSSDKAYSFIYPADTAQAAHFCSEKLKEKGWAELDKNEGSLHTFIKSEGIYRWCALQFFELDDKTNILVNTELSSQPALASVTSGQITQ